MIIQITSNKYKIAVCKMETGDGYLNASLLHLFKNAKRFFLSAKPL